MLEDDPAANAGLGSNLTVEGTVECDASIMEGAERTFGACGAVAGVRNPIALAARVLRQQQGHVLSLGRVHPVMLVSEGARRWAEAHDVPVCPATALVTPEARARWEGYRRSLCLSDQGDQGGKGGEHGLEQGDPLSHCLARHHLAPRRSAPHHKLAACRPPGRPRPIGHAALTLAVLRAAQG